MMPSKKPEAILVLPYLRIQNANAISSPLTHGFPSITAFIGFMWALQRKLKACGIPLNLLSVGVVCHHHQEQVNPGFVRTFNLTRNPVTKDGTTASIVEEGRIHLQVSLIFAVAEHVTPGQINTLVQGGESQMQDWATQVGNIASHMRIAGGSVLPPRLIPGKKTRPWMALLDDDAQARRESFRVWRRQWLPGFVLVEREDVLKNHLAHLRTTLPDATLLDAWLHASRFNYEVLPEADGQPAADSKVRWGDPFRKKGDGWTVPIPVGYAALSPRHPAGTVVNARDMTTELRFVESVYSIGEWISPHQLTHVEQLLWFAETDETQGLYRCRNTYKLTPTIQQAENPEDAHWDEEDDDYMDD